MELTVLDVSDWTMPDASAAAASYSQGLADVALHVVQRTLHPRLLICMASYDAASKIRQVVQRLLNPRLLNSMAPCDVARAISVRPLRSSDAL